MANLLHPKLSYKLTGLCFKAHKELGRFAKEKQYSDKVEELLIADNIEFKREFEIGNIKSDSPKGNRVDFIIENKIIIDVKAKKFVTKEDYIQMQRYLNASGIELGLIVNFRHVYLKPKRIINFSSYSNH